MYPKIISISPPKKKNFFFFFDQLKDKNLFFSVQVDVGGYGISWNDFIDLSEYELYVNSKEVATI